MMSLQLVSALLAAAGPVAAAASSPAAAPLNLLFLLIDDLGSNDMGWSQQLNGFSTAGAEGQAVDTVCSPTRAT